MAHHARCRARGGAARAAPAGDGGGRCGISCTVGMPGSEDVVELLGRVPAFSMLERDDLGRIAQVAVPRAFAPGQVVFKEGDESDTCYVVREGQARAIRRHSDGRTITLATFGPG